MKKTDLQIAKARIIQTFFFGPFGIILVISILFWKFTDLLLRGLIILWILLTIIIIMGFSLKNCLIKSHDHFVDRPFPHLLDLLKKAARTILLVLFICVTTLPLFFLANAMGIGSLSSWFCGAVVYGVWFFFFDLIVSLTTKYLILDDGIQIIHGLSRVFLSYSSLSAADITIIPKIPFSKRLRTRSPLILGVRTNSLVAIKQNQGNWLSNLTPEIYLTPVDPINFRNLVNRHFLQ